MRFGLPDQSDASDASSVYSYTSDDSDFEVIPKEYDEPKSHLGRRIRGFVDSSDSEMESDDDDDDDFGLLGIRQGQRTNGVTVTKTSVISSSKDQTLWRTSQSVVTTSRKGKERAIEWDEDSTAGKLRSWIKATEEDAMREGRKAASERRARLREINQNARLSVSVAEKDRTAREEEEMARMLEGLVLQQAKKEEELAQRFAEREKKLWADIDAAIQHADRAEAERKAAELADAKVKKAEAEAKAAAAEKEAQARRAQAEKMARDKMAELEAKKEQQRLAAEQLAKEAERLKAADTRGKTSSEWRVWVEKQKWMKKEVIEIVKADRATRTGLRTAMRLITRNLGQVTNSKETIVRVTNDIHKLLVDQLPSPPSPSSPTTLDDSPSKSYAYMLSHFSKALIKQAESEVSAKAEAAFPLARVVVGLLLRGHGALGEVLYARLVKKCPWVIPFFPNKQPDQSREEYEKSTGRGSDETKTDYIARMAGITTLYFAVLQTSLGSMVSTLPATPTPAQLPSLITAPLRFPAAWTWLSNACRDPVPALEPTAHLITAWIENVGQEVTRVYGAKQAGKALDALYREGIEGGKVKGDSEAARQRLALVLESWKREGLSHPKAREWE